MDVTVTLPDGANKDTFKSTIESSCSDMYGGVTGATVACPTSVTLTTVPAELESGGDANLLYLQRERQRDEINGIGHALGRAGLQGGEAGFGHLEDGGG